MLTQISGRHIKTVYVVVCHGCGRELQSLISLEHVLDMANGWKYDTEVDATLCSECVQKLHECIKEEA